MNRLAICALLSFLLVGAAPSASQTIHDRISGVQNGFVRMAFAARPGVCGSGHNFYTSRDGNDNWEPICDGGPVLVLLERRNGETVDIDTFVGGRWRDRADATDLGTVGAATASRFFLAHAQTQSRSAEDAIVPATLADSISVWPELARMARNVALRTDVRKASLFWTAQLGDNGVVDLLLDFVRSESDLDLREHAVFAISQHDSERAQATLLDLAADQSEGNAIRKKAIFWLGQRGRDITPLIDMYDRLVDADLKEHLLFVYSQRRGDDAALDKLMQVVRDDDNRALQRKAIFWLGQTRDPRAVEFLAELIG